MWHALFQPRMKNSERVLPLRHRVRKCNAKAKVRYMAQRSHPQVPPAASALRAYCLWPSRMQNRSVLERVKQTLQPLCEWIARSSNRCRKCSICVYACVHVCLCMRICIQDSQVFDSAVRTHSKGTCTHARNPAHPNLYSATRDGG